MSKFLPILPNILSITVLFTFTSITRRAYVCPAMVGTTVTGAFDGGSVTGEI